MKRVWIVKLGSTFAELARRRGDFEDWIGAGLGLPAARVEVCDPQQRPLPEPGQLAGVVLSGSHSSVLDREPWSELTAKWIPDVLRAEVPFLGICYGHQLLGHAMGGEVARNPRGEEFGTVEIRLHEAAGADPLFRGLPVRIPVHAVHSDTVLRLPAGAVCLASGEGDPHHAFALGKAAWGVQFHPEFDADAVRAYIEDARDSLRGNGLDPEELLATVRETPHAAGLLKRFAELAE